MKTENVGIMDIRFMAKVTPRKMFNQDMLQIIIPKKTAIFYSLYDRFFTEREVFVTIQTKENIEEDNIIEASDVENIIKMQKKGEIVSKKIKLKLRKTFDTAKGIHEYAQEHKDFKEPEWVKALFNEPDALDKAIERVVNKARIKEEKEKELNK